MTEIHLPLFRSQSFKDAFDPRRFNRRSQTCDRYFAASGLSQIKTDARVTYHRRGSSVTLRNHTVCYKEPVRLAKNPRVSSLRSGDADEDAIVESDQPSIASACNLRDRAQSVLRLFSGVELIRFVGRPAEHPSWGSPRIFFRADMIVKSSSAQLRIPFVLVSTSVVRPRLERSPFDLAHFSSSFFGKWAPRHCFPELKFGNLSEFGQEGHMTAPSVGGMGSALTQPDSLFKTISNFSAGGRHQVGVLPKTVTVWFPGKTSLPPVIFPLGFEEARNIGALITRKRPDHSVEADREANVQILFLTRCEPHFIESWGLDKAQLESDLLDAALDDQIHPDRGVIHVSIIERIGLPGLEVLALAPLVAPFCSRVTRKIVRTVYPRARLNARPRGHSEIIRSFVNLQVRHVAPAAPIAYSAKLNRAHTTRKGNALCSKILKGEPK